MSLSGKLFKAENVLSDEDFEALKSYAGTLPLESSFVYHRGKELNMRDPAVRKSQSVSVSDPAILDFIEDKIFNKVSDDLIIKRARDHVTFIKYKEGGFFDWHQDYEKYIIDDRRKWIEMHLLFCLERAAEGGELTIKINGAVQSHQYVNNGVMLFDKRMEHCAEEVLEGTKIIMTVDVLVSTTLVQDSDGTIDLEIEPLLDTGYLSYDHAAARRTGLGGGSAFCLMETDACTLIYDSNGCYYYNNKTTRQEWTRGERRAPPHLQHDLFLSKHGGEPAIVQIILSEDDADIVRGHIDVPNMKSYEPLPEGMDVKELLDLPRIHKMETENIVGYTYHCNEPSYGQTKVNTMTGWIPIRAAAHSNTTGGSSSERRRKFKEVIAEAVEEFESTLYVIDDDDAPSKIKEILTTTIWPHINEANAGDPERLHEIVSAAAEKAICMFYIDDEYDLKLSMILILAGLLKSSGLLTGKH